jgi:hypothetical protein
MFRTAVVINGDFAIKEVDNSSSLACSLNFRRIPVSEPEKLYPAANSTRRPRGAASGTFGDY